MDNPVETIGAASARIARLAAMRVMLCAVAPALTAIALGFLLDLDRRLDLGEVRILAGVRSRR